MILPPNTAQELLHRAQQLAGLTLQELAQQLNIEVPHDFSRDKGWGGILLERALGATAGSRPEPDFPALGIEMKTLPISSIGQPLETTFVCVAPMKGMTGEHWETSALRHKLDHVLWVPILAEKHLSPAERQIGSAFLWRASAEQELALRQDWEELMELLSLGRVERINAHLGQFMQLRPKAANGSVKTDAIGANGELVQAQPKGFYLRTSFTQWVLRQQFAPE
ncbi:DNA mismatch repair endonuclease MutH [Echinimonas agarilytica]|uniref:DNA mismatch repair protein MutH n=1 Tax=Echinimonas agarilytica TaxID=1215918 RepID=A0AA41W8Q8_9GAMM|nr:DNA mismatch repair endonuclease MutH [Echinimonas agarilytica]MCM2680582.1 DNA mismatch repair endonuclease MutH [Echinimonas agarilytica]